MIIARWESKGGKYWVEVEEFDSGGWGYSGKGCGGVMGATSREDAIEKMRVRVCAGEFLPDAAKTPMSRTI